MGGDLAVEPNGNYPVVGAAGSATASAPALPAPRTGCPGPMARQKCHWQKAWWRKAAYFITAKKQRKKEKAMGRTLRLRDAALELEIAEGRPWNRGTDPVRMMNGVPALKGSPHGEDQDGALGMKRRDEIAVAGGEEWGRGALVFKP
ncbi:hypothetical protein GW7_21236 [Heterocephalus glaber]|uniref:Uncharacterized protein n=1 Tax=Heterocephalus glaber TaxID=10181 RepID=G5B811_HETGA|nr:hypothetical protein GW7_21236 [Heterocephalus glaber]